MAGAAADSRSGPSVFGSLPAAARFGFLPPPAEPATLLPPVPGPALDDPPLFAVPEDLYSAALDIRVPLTVAVVYAVTVKLLNRYNASRDRRPWAISRTRAFFAFVVAHNVFLAVYSAWTFVGMAGALRRSVVSPFSAGGGGLVGTVDSFCRLAGPAGLGNALFYDDEARLWQTYPGQRLADGVLVPSRTDVGRIWNEGLAFYGWIFYLSKFYEVFDTFIILAKGKLSSTLQTYHHAGAMMCMWAGMRYMAAPIWMFVFVNSGIHAMMYTYYTLTAFSIRVPTAVKRSLTTMQIAQFLVGASYAMAHSFITYTIPVSISDLQRSGAMDPAGAIKGASVVSPSAAATNGAVVEDDTPARRHQHSPDMATAQVPLPCVTTAGETFAIWLNVLYLAPLTYLFVRFFIRSYLRRSSQEAAVAAWSRGSTGGAAAGGAINGGVGNATVTEKRRRRFSDVALRAERAGWDAAKNMQREVYGEGQAENGTGAGVQAR